MAREEAIAARTVSDLLVDLFEVASPEKARGNTVTVREILDHGAKKVERNLVDQPAMLAKDHCRSIAYE